MSVTSLHGVAGGNMAGLIFVLLAVLVTSKRRGNGRGT